MKNAELAEDADHANSTIPHELPIRSFAKAVSWRITGSIDTILLAWFFVGELSVALAIGTTEIITKMILYYFHERIWSRSTFGKTCVKQPLKPASSS